MSVIHAPGRPKLEPRLIVFPASMVSLLGVLFFRLWFFQVIKASELTDRADATRKDVLLRPAPRGLIYDRNGVLLAGLKPEVVVSGVYSVLSKYPEEAARLSAALRIPLAQLKSKLESARHSPGLPSPIAVGVKPELATIVAESPGDFPGVSVDLMPTRYYPDGKDYPHVLGGVGMPDVRDKERIRSKFGVTAAQYVGKSGIERSFEGDLMGAPGVEVMEVDAKRRPLRMLQRDNPVPGRELILTIDSALQHLATRLMEEQHYAGAVVAIEPSTGEVLCMVSSPTYDQNLLQDGISKIDYQRLQQDSGKPMTKRAIESSYSPGSTFKIVTTLAAYQKGLFDPKREVFCDGAFHLGKARFSCLGRHGRISFQRALEKSCNTYFSELGFRTGEDSLRRASLEAGLGEPTAIDIGGEDVGLVPTSEYLARRFKSRRWYAGDTVNFSIGQGYVRATPLQMCDVAALVANDGVIYRPHLVRAIRGVSDNPTINSTRPEVLHRVQAGAQFWSTLKRAMIGVVEEGTAQRARIPGQVWAGKTGSTEHTSNRNARGKGVKTHSWFVGFAPATAPKIAVCVLVENAGHGGEVAAPLAKQVVEHYLTGQAAKAAAR